MGVAGRKDPRLAPWATVLRRYRGLCGVRQNYGPQAGEGVSRGEGRTDRATVRRLGDGKPSPYKL
jgi:hypothetical protein